MIDLPVYNCDGKEIERFSVDEAAFGGRVRYALLKQALVRYQANKRVGTAATKSRGMVQGSTRKLYRQKGTGNARMGNNRTNVRRGGGVAFAKVARDFSKGMPKKQRRLATLSAMLEKMLSGKVILVTDLKVDAPKTKEFAAILANLKIDRSCLVMIRAIDEDLYRSARNIPKVKVQPLPELNAGDVCNYMNVVFAKDAFEALLNGSINSEN